MLSLPEDRARRNDRVRAAPAVSGQGIKTAAHEHAGSTQITPAFPARWLDGLYVVGLVTERPCHHRRGSVRSAANLTPAPGRRTRPISRYAFAALVSRSLRVHRSLPQFATSRDGPQGCAKTAIRITDLARGAKGKYRLRAGQILGRLPVVPNCRPSDDDVFAEGCSQSGIGLWFRRNRFQPGDFSIGSSSQNRPSMAASGKTLDLPCAKTTVTPFKPRVATQPSAHPPAR